MEFRTLGPLEVSVDGRPLTIGGVRQQTVLAVLLLDANRTVTIERLVDAAYGNDRPATARSQVQISTSTLRRMFAAQGRHDVIATRLHGYVINIAARSLDYHQFEDLVELARRARQAGRLDEALGLYRKALALWRGEALSGIESRPVRIAASRLAECRITSNEDCIQLALDLGHHHELIGELTELVGAHPLRERLRGQLMTALYRCGRDAEALQVYQAGRRILIEELGIEPPRRLQQLEYAILTGDRSLDPPASRDSIVVSSDRLAIGAPRMLPTDIADFTNQAEHISRINGYLQIDDQQRTNSAVPVVVISGRAGAGKTALAVHIAHQIAEHFEDGQLFVDLHGTSTQKVSPTAALERFLRVLGVSGTAIPEGLEERAEVLRALLATRRTILVLDNAGTEGQVLPLLPGNPACAVIVTSRNRLTGLAGALRVELDVFDPRASVDLLARILGADRVRNEERASAKLAELCGGLPLALRIAGARMSARPNWSISQLVERLENDTHRLDELNHGEMGVRASLALSYENVSRLAQRLFRWLAILEPPQFSAWIAAALLDCPFHDADDLLDQLTDAHLVETVGASRGPLSQYRMHDLVRVFARERFAVEDSSAERGAVLTRMLSGLVAVAEAADCREYGLSPSPNAECVRNGQLLGGLVDHAVEVPLSWFDQERPTLVAGVAQAARAGHADLCWRLAISAARFFGSRSYVGDWRETHGVALVAAKKAGDRRGEATILCSLGALNVTAHRFTQARDDLKRAVDLFQEVRDERGVAQASGHLGRMDQLSGQFDSAATYYDQALSTLRRIQDNVGAAYVLYDLAALCIEREQPDEARRLLAEALQLSRDADCHDAEAKVSHRLGVTHLMEREHTAAFAEFGRALEFARELGNPTLEAAAQHGLGVTQVRMGQHHEAESTLNEALALAERSDQARVRALALEGLGDLALARQEPRRAVALLRQALDQLRDLGLPLHEARSLMVLAEAHFLDGDRSSARAAWARALALTRAVDPRLAHRMRTRLRGRLRRPVAGDGGIVAAQLV